MTRPIPVKLPPEILVRVDALAKRIGEPRSTVMRIAMRVGLEQLEKIFATEGQAPKTLSSLLYQISPGTQASVLNDVPPEKPKRPKKAA